MTLLFPMQASKAELLSAFAHKCSPRRGNVLKQVFEPPKRERLSSEEKNSPERSDHAWYVISDPLSIDKCSRMGFPLAFIAFNCIYWVVFAKI